MRSKKGKLKRFVIILWLCIFAVLLLGHCSKKHKIATSADPDMKPAVVWRTKTHQLCRVYAKDISPKHKAAIEKTIKSYLPNADCSAIAENKDWTYSEFDDGMMEIPLPMIVVNGSEYGGDIVMKFDGGSDDYSVHYLKIGPELLVDDGLYATDAYQEMEE